LAEQSKPVEKLREKDFREQLLLLGLLSQVDTANDLRLFIKRNAIFKISVYTPQHHECIMPSHELIYFDGAGRAEAIRILLHIAKADWKDNRFPSSDWPSVKATTPLGSVPILKIDGVDHVQSTALMRYAASLAGWYPQDPLERLVVDEVMESLNEMMAKAPKSTDQGELRRLRQEYQATTMTAFTTFFESHIQRNGGVGFAKTINVGDLALMSIVDGVSSGDWTGVDPKFFDQFSGVSATVAAVKDNEGYKSYYENN
jgi:glutathione S-transferase